MAFADFRHRTPLRVRWAEADMQGVVFNGHYLLYADVCLTEYWRAIDMPYPQALAALGCDLYARKASVEFHAPAAYDDELLLCGRVLRLGTSSLTFLVEMRHADRADEPPLATLELVYVNVDVKTRRPQPLPQRLRERIGAFEEVAPL